MNELKSISWKSWLWNILTFYSNFWNFFHDRKCIGNLKRKSYLKYHVDAIFHLYISWRIRKNLDASSTFAPFESILNWVHMRNKVFDNLGCAVVFFFYSYFLFHRLRNIYSEIRWNRCTLQLLVTVKSSFSSYAKKYSECKSNTTTDIAGSSSNHRVSWKNIFRPHFKRDVNPYRILFDD